MLLLTPQCSVENIPRDNFEESVEAFQRVLVSKCPSLSGDIGRVAEAARRLLSTSVKSYSSLSMLLTSDIIVELLGEMGAATFPSGEELVEEFCRRLHQSLVSPAIEVAQQKVVGQWIEASLAATGLVFSLNYPTEVSTIAMNWMDQPEEGFDL